VWREVPPFRTKTIRLLEGDLFAFTVDARGMYVDMPNLYCVVVLRPTGISLAAMTAKMNAVCQLHNWAAASDVDLRARIVSLDFFRKDEVASLRKELRVNLLTRPMKQARGGRRKPRREVASNSQWRSRCAAVRDYIAWHAEDAIQRMSARDERLTEYSVRRFAQDRLQHFRERLFNDVMAPAMIEHQIDVFRVTCRRRQMHLMQRRPASHRQITAQEFVIEDGHHATGKQKILLDLYVVWPRRMLSPGDDFSLRYHAFASKSAFMRTCQRSLRRPGPPPGSRSIARMVLTANQRVVSSASFVAPMASNKAPRRWADGGSFPASSAARRSDLLILDVRSARTKLVCPKLQTR
jgi:hypothetical protein